MSNPAISRTLYGVAIILSYALTAFAIQLGAGKVPISADWQWVVPILSAVVTGLLTLLPRVGGEGTAAEVDALRARGYRRRDLMVVPKIEWAGLTADASSVGESRSGESESGTPHA